jgi:hypothetical protein
VIYDIVAIAEGYPDSRDSPAGHQLNVLYYRV